MNRTRIRSLGLLLAILLAGASPPARAGDAVVPAPGDRVRIDYREVVTKRLFLIIPYKEREHLHVAGELVAITADAVAIRRDSDRALISRPLDGFDRLSVADGTRRHLIEGVLGGFLFGLLLSVPVAGPPDVEDGESQGDATAGLAVLIGCTVLGGIIGHQNVTDRWRRVPVPSPPRAAAVADRRRLGVGMVLRF